MRATQAVERRRTQLGSHLEESHFMLKKSNYNETGSVGAQSGNESNPSYLNPEPHENDEARVSIATKYEDIPRVRPRNASVFGSTLKFRGELSADEELLIQGTVEGTIAHHKKNVTVGKQGRVNALIHANSVTIEGRVDGDIHGDEFVLMAAGSEVNGNIYCPRIRMEDGAQFNGTIQMRH
jgi:cytoskeletal protein CcmA (bactofilin family)